MGPFSCNIELRLPLSQRNKAIVWLQVWETPLLAAKGAPRNKGRDTTFPSTSRAGNTRSIDSFSPISCACSHYWYLILIHRSSTRMSRVSIIMYSTLSTPNNSLLLNLFYRLKVVFVPSHTHWSWFSIHNRVLWLKRIYLVLTHINNAKEWRLKNLMHYKTILSKNDCFNFAIIPAQ